jgi:hypothetical protein
MSLPLGVLPLADSPVERIEGLEMNSHDAVGLACVPLLPDLVPTREVNRTRILPTRPAPAATGAAGDRVRCRACGAAVLPERLCADCGMPLLVGVG